MSLLCACSSVLMIFLAADPLCSSDNDEWEMKTNRKIVLCFSQPEPRTEWLKVRDPFVNFKLLFNICSFLHVLQAIRYSFDVPLIVTARIQEDEAKALEQQRREPLVQKPSSSTAAACAGVVMRGFSGNQNSMNGRYDLTSEEYDGYPRYKQSSSVLASSVEWWIEFHAASHSWQIKPSHAKGMSACEAFVPCFKADKSIASAQNGLWQVHIDSGEFRDDPLVQMDLVDRIQQI
jgi:hypothetical protein